MKTFIQEKEPSAIWWHCIKIILLRMPSLRAYDDRLDLHWKWWNFSEILVTWASTFYFLFLSLLYKHPFIIFLNLCITSAFKGFHYLNFGVFFSLLPPLSLFPTSEMCSSHGSSGFLEAPGAEGLHVLFRVTFFSKFWKASQFGFINQSVKDVTEIAAGRVRDGREGGRQRGKKKTADGNTSQPAEAKLPSVSGYEFSKRGCAWALAMTACQSWDWYSVPMRCACTCVLCFGNIYQSSFASSDISSEGEGRARWVLQLIEKQSHVTSGRHSGWVYDSAVTPHA